MASFRMYCNICTYVWLPLFGCIAVHTAIVRRTNICMASFIWMYCMFIQFGCNCKDNKHMYGFLYLDVLHVHTAIVRRTNICMASFIWMYCMFIQQLYFGCIACSYSNKDNKHMYGCSYSNRKENKHMYGFLYLDVLHVHTVHTAIVRRINICMASFIWMYWMYCMYCIQQL